MRSKRYITQSKNQKGQLNRFWFKVAYFCLSILVAFSGATDADISDSEVIENNVFSATTLDFAQRKTSNNLFISQLFNVTGIIPDGFEVAAIRIKKEGEMDFGYNIKGIKTLGDDSLCQNLSVVFVQDWIIKFDGLISNLNIDDRINDNGIDDWIILIRLDGSGQELTQKECQFDFVFSSWKSNPGDTKGFFDEEILTNRIISGNWAAN